MNDLSDALCRGQWALFDSTELSAHVQARAICAECPALMACMAHLRDVQRAALTIRGGGGPRGTWAGQLIGKNPHGRRGFPREHGSTKGYYQHKNRKEDACDECLDAMRLNTQQRRKAAS